MSLSLCVSLSAVHLFSLEHSKHLKPDVSELSQQCPMDVSRMFQGVKKFSKGVFKDV